MEKIEKNFNKNFVNISLIRKKLDIEFPDIITAQTQYY